MDTTDNIMKAVAGVVHPGESFLVALSGGADSVALLASLVELGHRCEALHCNYHLRGDESNRDEQHARAVAATLGVNIHVVDCDVEAYRTAHPGISIEMACRDIRYEAFNRYLAMLSLDSIALGHHLEDNIETMLLNMLRGSGVKGLAAMRPRRDGHVRPLLRCSKQDILDYLSSRGLTYVTDSSNLSNDYRRNALRNDIIPLMTRYFPSGIQGMANTLQALASQRDLLDDTLQLKLFVYSHGVRSIDVKSIVELEEHPEALLFELLNYPDYRGYTATTVANIVRNYRSSGLLFEGTDGTAYRLEQGTLNPVETLTNQPAGGVSLDFNNLDSLTAYFEWDIIEPVHFKPCRDNSTAYFDLDVLRSYKNIILRAPRDGDRIKPWGMKGSRLLSDIFTDLHYTHSQRLDSRVLDADGELLWLVGIRASRLASVTPATTRILRLRSL